MASYLNLIDAESLRAKISEKAHDLFKPRPGKPELQVDRFSKTRGDEAHEAVCLMQTQDIEDVSQIKTLRQDSNDCAQCFVIRQDRSWTTLNISQELFEEFTNVYNVFPHFWKFVFTFGRKYEENEFEFPGCKARQAPRSDSNQSDLYESACVLRRAELNHRVLIEGQSPWSIRQTAVYHKLSLSPDHSNSSASAHPIPPSEPSRSTFLLIAPSQSLERQLAQSFELGVSNECAVAQCNVHRLLVADSLRGWPEYMAWLEEQLKKQSNRIIFAKVGTEKGNLSLLKDFNISFIDRQALKLLEDSVIDLQIILPTMFNTVSGIREQSKKYCERYCKQETEGERHCGWIIEEFDEHVKELEMHVQRVHVLREKAKSTARLLSDLLSYEDAVALKDLARESQLESRAMCSLTERSTKDAAAVKALTVIGLMYLPSTIVANFFSTQFVHTNDSGNMRVSASAWLLAAIAIPLTAVTIAIWWIWVHCRSGAVSEPSQHSSLPRLQRRSCSLSLLSPKKKQKTKDTETGMAFSVSVLHNPEISPPPFQNSGAGSWSTTATTAKAG